MNKFLIVILIISIVGNVVGLFFAYKYRKLGYRVAALQDAVAGSGRVVSDLTDRIEAGYSKRLLFVHHSVGQGMLDEGGLTDSLLNMGIFVKGATYGDEIGQKTDMCDWLPKFTSNFKKLIEFKNHPDQYYKDGRTNDVIVFKSCYPNSHIESQGSGAGSASSSEKTVQNYKATFSELAAEFRKYPDKLFVYMTYPPLTPLETTPEAATRAREFNNWLLKEFLPNYQRESGLQNFQIFDLFDVLAGEDNVLRRQFRREDERDSHPNTLGSKEATRRFMEFFSPIWKNWQSRVAGSTQSEKSKISS